RRRIGFGNNELMLGRNCMMKFVIIFNPFSQVYPVLFSMQFSFLPVLFVWDGWRRRTFFPLGTTRRVLCRDCRILQGRLFSLGRDASAGGCLRFPGVRNTSFRRQMRDKQLRQPVTFPPEIWL